MSGERGRGLHDRVARLTRQRRRGRGVEPALNTVAAMVDPMTGLLRLVTPETVKGLVTGGWLSAREAARVLDPEAPIILFGEGPALQRATEQAASDRVTLPARLPDERRH